MTMIKAVGAEFNTLLELDGYLAAPTNYISLESTIKRGGNYAFKLQAPAGLVYEYIQLNLSSAKAEAYYQVAFYITALPTAVSESTTYSKNRLLSFFDGSGNYLASIEILISGKLRAWIGDVYSGTQIMTDSVNAVSINSWMVLEAYYKVGDSPDGALTVRLNGTEEITFSGDSKPGAGTTVSYIRIGNAYSSHGFGTIYIDDMIINDISVVDALNPNNSWPNGLKIVLLKPTAAGNHTEWTPSTGDNYAAVDEVPPSIADYLTTAVNGIRDTYVIENCPAGMGPIAAVIPTYYGQVSGTPACVNIKRLMRSSGSDQVSANIALPNTFGRVQEILEISPFTSLPFTVSEIDGVEFGQQSAT